MKRCFRLHYVILKLGVLCFLALFMSACETIPPGIAPKGPLVQILDTSSSPMSQSNAINQMITALSTSNCFSGNISNVIIAESSYPDLYKMRLFKLPITVYRNLLDMGVIRVDPLKQADYNMYARFYVSPTSERGACVINWTTFITFPGTKDVEYSYAVQFYLPKVKEQKHE